MRLYVRILTISLLAHAIIISIPKATAQTVTRRLTISSPRPIADALEKLEQQYGWVITYEDPEYVSLSDVRDATPPWKTQSTNGQALRRIFIPRGGTLNFQYQENNGHPLEAPSDLIRRLVASYATGNNPQFAVIQDRNEWHIVPKRSLNRGGSMADATAVLDAVITIPAERRTSLDLISAICAEVSRVTQRRVLVGTVPTNPLRGHIDESGATNQIARDVLKQALSRFFVHFSWALYYDPSGFYALNIDRVPPPAKNN
ncbi:MAG TPA: hypothetical protein VJ731_12990 [Terriglobales bacterium]|nr:hypothetical protein [Terriglobales bacterium]